MNQKVSQVRKPFVPVGSSWNVRMAARMVALLKLYIVCSEFVASAPNKDNRGLAGECVCVKGSFTQYMVIFSHHSRPSPK